MKKSLVGVVLFLPWLVWATPNTISVEQVHQAITSEAGLNATIVDVRTPAEFAQGHVPGAINIPHREIGDYIDKLAPMERQGLVLYCRSGKRAGIAIDALQKAGFSNLTHMQGDMSAWFDAEYPIEKPE